MSITLIIHRHGRISPDIGSLKNLPQGGGGLCSFPKGITTEPKGKYVYADFNYNGAGYNPNAPLYSNRDWVREWETFYPVDPSW